MFVFTPTGDVMELKYGATPLDFAYSIHTEVGNKCVGAKANGKIVPLKYRLKSGDVLEIITSKTQTPSKDWLKLVKTSKAKTKIKQWLLKTEREKDKQIGQDLLEKSFKVYGTSIKNLKKTGELERIYKDYKFKSEEELYINLGGGKIPIKELVKKLSMYEETQEDLSSQIKEVDSQIDKIGNVARKASHKENAVIVDGMDDVLVRMAKCCNPIPGDSIVGFITRGRGITVHTSQCSKKSTSEFERNIKVEWNSDYSFTHPVNIRVMTHDRPGILSQISKAINNIDINIRSAIARSMPDQKGSFIFEVEVKDYSELLKVMNAIEGVNEVISVERF